MWTKAAASLLALASTASAQVKGFNYGSTNNDGSCRGYDDFVRFFNEAKSLPGNSGSASARLYTSVQCGTAADPIEAFRAAIDTDTSILAGLWASAGRDGEKYFSFRFLFLFLVFHWLRNCVWYHVSMRLQCAWISNRRPAPHITRKRD